MFLLSTDARFISTALTHTHTHTDTDETLPEY